MIKIYLTALILLPVLGLAAPRKVIIDQDAFGSGGPNLQPILLVLQSPDVEVLGITVESGDGWQKENVAHTLRMLEIIGRTDVPVVVGATLPLTNTPEATKRWEARHGQLVYKGAWTEQWPPGTVNRRPIHPPEVVPPSPEGEPTTRPLNEPADMFLVRKVREFPGEVSILALGPQTNLALALKRDPALAGLAQEIVIMGGSFNPQAANNEFAPGVCPHAAAGVQFPLGSRGGGRRAAGAMAEDHALPGRSDDKDVVQAGADQAHRGSGNGRGALCGAAS